MKTVRLGLTCGHYVEVTYSSLPARSERRRNLSRTWMTTWYCRTCQSDEVIVR